MIFKFKKNKGFSILEIIISVAIFSMILLAVFSFFTSINNSNSKIKADKEAGENARKVLDQIIYEIKGAKSIYTPTTAQNQLSLETTRYLPEGETSTFIDFFICGQALCIKKESQAPVALTPDGVRITDLTFFQIAGAIPSVKVSLTLEYGIPGNYIASYSSITLTSTASLRNY